MIRVGPSGWVYRDWAGIVYPKPQPRGFDPLGYLAHFFDTLEINSTFTRPVRRYTAWAWEERVTRNPHFRFTARLWSRFTHARKRTWSPEEVDRFRLGMDILAQSGRLGVLVIGFPASFRRNDESREQLELLLTVFRDYPLVLEVPHTSWDEPEFRAELAEQGIGLVNAGPPPVRDAEPSDQAKPEKTNRAAGWHGTPDPDASVRRSVGYLRLHEPAEHAAPHAGEEPEENKAALLDVEAMAVWSQRARKLAASPGTGDVYLITPHQPRGRSAAHALVLRAMLREERVPAPPSLWGEHGALLEEFAWPAPASAIRE